MSFFRRSNTPSAQRRRAVGRLLQKAQHALPGLVLLRDGVNTLRQGAGGWHLTLAAAEVATAAAVIVAFASAFRALRAQLKGGGVPHPHAGIDWVDVFIGAMLYTEVWVHHLEGGKLFGSRALLAAVMIVLGFWGHHIVPWKKKQLHRFIGDG